MEVASLTSTVVEALREKIIIGELKPGYKLNEVDISINLGVSRPPCGKPSAYWKRTTWRSVSPGRGLCVRIVIEGFHGSLQTRR